MLILTLLSLHVAAWSQTDSTGYTPMGSGYTPSSVTSTVEYDATTGSYVRVTRVGDMVLGREYMTFEEYQDWQMDNLLRNYWEEKSEGTVLDNAAGGLLSKIPGFNQISQKLDFLNGKPPIDIHREIGQVFGRIAPSHEPRRSGQRDNAFEIRSREGIYRNR